MNTAAAETSAQIFKESLPIVSNPPQSTTRSPEAIQKDFDAQLAVVKRFDEALVREGKVGSPTVNGDPHYVLSNFHYELLWAKLKGNK